MTYCKMRQIAAKALPEIADVILDTNNCFEDIFKAVIANDIKYKAFKLLDKMPSSIKSEWAYEWALHIGNHDIMRDRVTSSQYAYYWARDIGDHDIMRDRVTDPFYKDLFDKLACTNPETC